VVTVTYLALTAVNLNSDRYFGFFYVRKLSSNLQKVNDSTILPVLMHIWALEVFLSPVKWESYQMTFDLNSADVT
jgi:hypothetical protein